MEEISIWMLEGGQVSQLSLASRVETEGLLEDALVRRPDLLMEDLTLVGRQTPTEGGPLDLLGVDGEGRLVVFELKRGTLTREAVAQVIDYASYLDSMDLDDLANHISQRSGSRGIEKRENFEDWYAGEFPDFESLASLKPLRMFLVGLGVDAATERMVKFLAENTNMKISLLTFHGFKYEGKTILAKQVEVSGIKPPENAPPGREERWKLLESRVDEFGIRDLYDGMRSMFCKNWPASRQMPSAHRTPPYGRNINVKLGSSTYARMDTRDDGMGLAFYPQSVVLDVDAFKQIDIQYYLWPKDKENVEDPDTQAFFLLKPEEWEKHQEKLTGLVQSLYKAWQNREQ